MKLLYALASLLALDGCTVARPFARPTAAPQLAPDDPVVVVVSWARLHIEQRDIFDDYTRKLIAALDRGDYAGLVGFSVRRELLGDEVWTMTAWQNDEAMRAFAEGELHGAAMREAYDAMVDFRTLRLVVPARDVPLAWKDAVTRLEAAAKPAPRPDADEPKRD